MQTSSAKAKGRLGQQEVCGKLTAKREIGLEEGEIASRPMGSQGDDIIAPPRALRQLYFDAWEVKRRAKIGICRWFDQVLRRKAKKPIVCFREDRGEWYAMVRLDDLIELLAIRAKNDHIAGSGNMVERIK